VAYCNYFVDGIRKSKTVDGITTNYYNDGSNVIIEKDGNNNLLARNIKLTTVKEMTKKRTTTKIRIREITESI
jgi:hypothetical protein